MLSMTTDFATSKGSPQEDLKLISEAGYSHVHWCHQWNTDFLYSTSEIDQIEAWFKEYGLQLTDLHASAGKEKNWGSLLEYERQSGVELIANRIEMTARLGADVIVMHFTPQIYNDDTYEQGWAQMRKSLDELKPIADTCGVRIAMENGKDNFDLLERVFSEYPAEYVGLCYDCGHGNMATDGIDRFDTIKDRLICLHLHDNDGEKDQHKLLFTGTLDWEKLAGLIAASGYTKWVQMEVSMGNTGIEDKAAFLKQAYEDGQKFSAMIEKAKA